MNTSVKFSDKRKSENRGLEHITFFSGEAQISYIQ